MPEPDAAVSVAVSAQTPRTAEPLYLRLMPRASARVQLILAAVVWFIGGCILGVRGVVYLTRSHWAAWLLAFALVLGVVKGHLILDRVARRAVDRIQARGRERCLFGFFSWKSWLLIVVMMGGGIFLRNSGAPYEFLGVLYVAVATALFYGDRTYWKAVVSG